MKDVIRIGTRDSQLAVWQATLVKDLLAEKGYSSTLVYVKTDGDIDLQTPLYEMGIQGIFTKSLDIALLNNTIDIAVHSMKDVPTQLPEGIVQAAVLKRGNWRDLFVTGRQWLKINGETAQPLAELENFRTSLSSTLLSPFSISVSLSIATSSVRRKSQWLHRYPNSVIENLRGNVNTRLKKLEASDWEGAIFAAAGLERISLRPNNAIELDWMLPSPAQGAIMIVCRKNHQNCLQLLSGLNDEETAACTKVERDFLREFSGGCSTPISALAQVDKNDIYFKGNILSPDGKQKAEIEKSLSKENIMNAGLQLAIELSNNGGREIAGIIQHAK